VNGSFTRWKGPGRRLFARGTFLFTPGDSTGREIRVKTCSRGESDLGGGRGGVYCGEGNVSCDLNYRMTGGGAVKDPTKKRQE